MEITTQHRSTLRHGWHFGFKSAITIFLVTLLAISTCSVRATTFYVAPNGEDTNPGTQDKPFVSLSGARDAVRTLKQSGSISGPISIIVREGDYRLSASFTLDAQDTGTPDAPVTWQAAGPDTRLYGGIKLSGEAFVPVTDPDVLSRLDPQARDQVRQVDLKAAGISNIGQPLDCYRSSPDMPELFFNDERCPVACWPNEGWATVARIIDSGSIPRDNDTEQRGGVFQYEGDRPQRWRVEDGVWLKGFWCYDWFDQTIRVKSIDPEQRLITLAAPATYGIKQGNPAPRRYKALNLLEELDRPGEYYIDRTAGILYLWPPADLASARIVLSTLKAPLVLLDHTSHVTLRGFIIEAGLGDGIEVRDGSDNRIEMCQVRNMRFIGIRVLGGTEHRVVGTQIHDTGTGGLLLEGGDRKTLTPAGHQALDNQIWRFSCHQLTYTPGITLSGVGNRAAHNLIYDAPHEAISIRGNDHVFELNVIHHVVTGTDDAGALYKGRDPSCRGNMIRFNFWHDIGSPLGHGTAAVYFDDGDGGDTVFGNVFLRCGYSGRGSFGTVFSHGGHDNLAENNLFIDCDRALGSAPWSDERWENAIEGKDQSGWQKKLLEDVDITQPPYTTHYPELVGFMQPQPGQVRVNRANNNVLVRCRDATKGNWTFDPTSLWSTDADPGFIDAEHDNYQLRDDAEVFKHLPSFEPIPFNRIGPRKALHIGSVEPTP